MTILVVVLRQDFRLIAFFFLNARLLQGVNVHDIKHLLSTAGSGSAANESCTPTAETADLMATVAVQQDRAGGGHSHCCDDFIRTKMHRNSFQSVLCFNGKPKRSATFIPSRTTALAAFPRAYFSAAEIALYNAVSSSGVIVIVRATRPPKEQGYGCASNRCRALRKQE